MTGSGTAGDPYVIWDVNDLQDMNLDLTAYYELGQDIDASATIGWHAGLGFIPIGDWGVPFTGVLDGKGYTVSDLYINRPANYVSLLGYVNGAHVYNTTLSVNFTGDTQIGAFVGATDVDGVCMENCHASGSVTGLQKCGGLIGYIYCDGSVLSFSDCSSSVAVVGTGNFDVGGFIGQLWADNLSTIFERCYATGNVTGKFRVGGFGGEFTFITAPGMFYDCYATGNVTSTDALGDSIGGFIGDADMSTYTRCYATGDAVGLDDNVGGFIGMAWDSIVATRCYSIGNVTGGGDHIGGFVGEDFGNTYTDCYARGNVTASATSANVGGFSGGVSFAATATNCYYAGVITCPNNPSGFCDDASLVPSSCFWDTELSGVATDESGATGKTTAEMKDKGTFIGAGWDLSAIWGAFVFCNDGYPCLRNVTLGCIAECSRPTAYALSREEL